MENITKALMIAGGILLAILILSLLAVFMGEMSGYYQGKHNSTIIQQNTEFNKQFENYNGQTVRGNELITVMNKVVNYNNSIVGIEGDYDKVIMTIDFKGYHDVFKYQTSSASIFQSVIKGNKLGNTQSSDNNLTQLTSFPGNIVSQSGYTEIQLQKLSSEIANIMIDEQLNSNKISKQEKENLKETRNKKLKNILGKSEISDAEITKIKSYTTRYYEYTQFKRAVFKCTGVQYNTQSNGRVNEITFEIVIDSNGNVKFD